jgi:DNA repair photolyase
MSIIQPNLKKVISASRRVDLLSFYPDYLIQRIEEIGKENIHTLVLWTKNPLNIFKNKPLRKYLKTIDQLYLLLTVTGLGGTPLEPKAPQTDMVLKSLPDLVDFLGSPLRLALRYDPLIQVVYDKKNHLTNIDPTIFQHILNFLKPLGVKRVITSYVTLYPKVKKRLSKYNFQTIEHPIKEIEDFILEKMTPQVEKLGIEVSTCVLPEITSKGCIDGKTLIELHPQKELCSLVKDKTQRISCHCTKSVDIGRWFSCYHGCLYCYGNPSLKKTN